MILSDKAELIDMHIEELECESDDCEDDDDRRRLKANKRRFRYLEGHMDHDNEMEEEYESHHN